MKPEDKPVNEIEESPIAGAPPNTVNEQPIEQSNNNTSLPTDIATEPSEIPINTPGTIILQWLTYAFWGWTVLVSSILATASISNMILGSDTGEFTTYALAAVLVLLPISIVCDIFYSKKEPQKKTGAAMVVMVIHAVLFALIGIGTLITAVFAVVQMLTNGGQSGWSKVTLFSALVGTVLYLATFLRTLSPAQLPWVSKIYKLFMIVAVIIITVMCVVGPISYEYATKNDKLIVSNIYTVKDSINSYTIKNDKLPENLGQLNLKGNAKVLVDKNLVKYSPGSAITSVSKNNSKSTIKSSKTYNYTLCVNYAKADKSSSFDDGYSSSSRSSAENYDSYTISTYGHPAGEVCYKLKTSPDYNYDDYDSSIDAQ